MKKNTTLLTTLALLGAGIGLASCGTPAAQDCPTCPECPVCPTPEKNEFAITKTAAEGTEIAIENEAASYKAGTLVSFRVNLAGEQYGLESVTVDGKAVNANAEGVYSFTMVNHDVVIETKSVTLGDASIVTITPFTKETLPAVKNVSDLKALLEESNKSAGKFFKSATFKTTSNETSITNDLYDYRIEAGHNDVLNIDGTVRSYASDDANSPVHEQRFIQGKKYIERKSSIGSSGVNDDVNIMNITDATEVPYGEIGAAQAKENVTSYNYIDKLSQLYLESYNYDWSKATPTIAANKDRTIVTITFELIEADSYSSEVTVTTLKAEVDGDKFVHSVNVDSKVFDSKDCDGTTNVPNAGAVAKEHKTFAYDAIRGYKKFLPLRMNTADYVMNDYDVVVQAKFDGKTTEHVNGGTVLGNSVLNFRFDCRDNDNFLVKPTFIGFAEGEKGFFAEGSKEITSLGTCHLVFDNGLGELKTIEVTAIEPKATKITATAASKYVFLGDSVDVEVKVEPSTANQEVTLVKGATSADCTIAQGANANTFKVTGTTLGKIVLEASAVKNAELKKEITIDVIEKPTYEAVYACITTKTLEEQNVGYGDPYKLKFNTDGTGTLSRMKYDWNSDMDVEKFWYFNYTIDQATLDFTITEKAAGDLGYTMVDFRAVTSSTFQADIYLGWKTETKDFAPAAF